MKNARKGEDEDGVQGLDEDEEWENIYPGLYSSGMSGMSTRSITAATITKMAGTSQPTVT